MLKKQNKIINRKTELCHHRPRSKAHSNEYENNTHKAEQSLPASRGAGGRNSFTRLTSTYEHSECIQTRRLGLTPLPKKKKHTHTGCGRTGKERLLDAGSTQNSGRPTDKETLRGASRRLHTRERRGVCVSVLGCVYPCVCIRPARVGWLQKGLFTKQFSPHRHRASPCRPQVLT